MRLVPILFPCDLGRSDRGTYVAGGCRGAPDMILDALEAEGVRFARPLTVSVDVPDVADEEQAPLKFDAAVTKAVLGLAEVVEQVNADANFPLVLGGDHTGLMGHVLGNSRRHEAGIGLAVLADAFLDLESPARPVFDDRALRNKDPEVTSTGDAERMVLAAVLKKIGTDTALGRAMLDSAVSASQTSVVGVRAPKTAQVRANEKAAGIDVWDMERLEFDGESGYRSMLTRHLSQGPIVLSIDVTGLDPDMMTASRGAPSDGLDWTFLKRTLEQCVPHVDRILGLDICAVDHTADDGHQGGLTRFAETLAPFLRKLTR